MTKDQVKLSDMHKQGIFLLNWMGCKLLLMNMLSVGRFCGHTDKDWQKNQDGITVIAF